VLLAVVVWLDTENERTIRAHERRSLSIADQFWAKIAGDRKGAVNFSQNDFREINPVSCRYIRGVFIQRAAKRRSTFNRLNRNPSNGGKT
jgi:hypothetical protein